MKGELSERSQNLQIFLKSKKINCVDVSSPILNPLDEKFEIKPEHFFGGATFKPLCHTTLVAQQNSDKI